MFVERITPRIIIPRLYRTEMTVRDLHNTLVTNINGEFEHNLSQQIYVSPQVWESVKGVKEQELAMINAMARSLDPDAPARELHSRILEVLQRAGDAELPSELALKMINTEAAKVMTYGSY
jgi:hypothetical protein